MEMILLKTGVQLMTLLTTSFLTMKATPWRCIESSPLNNILCPSSVDVSPNPGNLNSASPMISQRLRSSSYVSSWTVTHAFSVLTFHVLLVVPFVANLIDG
ncbi:hypothetical protein DPMN_122407 [Dreissena polymorpha]|uniref:Uncharacterized protein n=1 Tax=Dreissena polymorpha TaxID=45954 RepID=A0A9D4GNZ2_DREPO|nr:hypothetical protein DPMN_122407 [Dreissena polymorpha]